MHDNERRIHAFYTAFAQRDAEAMAAAYAPDVTFSDPVFQGLRGAEVGDMWRMLCSRAKDLEVTFDGVSADDRTGRAHWEARYTFGATGRRVHNVIDASFRFAGGLIAAHEDVFDFWRWSRMAIGPKGTLLGWSPLVRNAVRAQAKKGLDAWRSNRSM